MIPQTFTAEQMREMAERVLRGGVGSVPVMELEPMLRFAADQLEQLPQRGWQPIATAPKDGTPIRVFARELIHEDFNVSGSVEGYWQDDQGWIGAVWCAEHDQWHEKVVWPTHWMPLPSPPADTETRR